MMKLGIDEAGRGPVIGSMFVAGVLLDENSEELLMKAGVRDSKLLTPNSRMKLLTLILKEAKFVAVIERKPWEVDSYNINKLFIESVVSIVKLTKGYGHTFDRVIVDSTSSRRELVNALIKEVGSNAEVIVEDRADRKYVVVAAASIVAKCFRDTHVKYLHLKYGDFGSGYPSDPKTIEWLKRFSGSNELPPIVRRSWRTLKRLGIRTSLGEEGILKWLKGRSNEGR